MPESDLAQQLDRAALAYRPDLSNALSKVERRVVRRKRTRRSVSAVLVAGVAVALLVLLLNQPGQPPANGVRYLAISPTARIVPLSSPSNGLTDVYFEDSIHGIGMEQHCVLSPVTNTQCSLVIVRTNDAGRMWAPVGQPLTVTYPNSRASYPFIDFATNGKDGWIYGSKTFVTHDGGKTFHQDGPGGIVMDLSIVGNQTWALSRPCPPGVPGCSSSVFIAATNGGPWRVDQAGPKLEYPYLQLLRTSDTNAFLVAQATDGTVYATTDGGVSWERHPLPGPCNQLVQLTALDAHDLWALCSGPAPSHSQTKDLYHSVDGGGSWTLAATSNSPTTPGVGRLPELGIVTLLTSVSPDRLLIAFDQGAPIASTDGGRTWKPQGLPASGGVKQLSFTDAQHGWAVLYPDDVLYRTSDGGVEWTQASS
jgi:photosystem II stability/assembly factor-like uncharacterized protein